MKTRTCAVCTKLNRSLADCPHPGRPVSDLTELTARPIDWTVAIIYTTDEYGFKHAVPIKDWTKWRKVP